MNAKTIILTAAALVIGIATRAQEPETAQPDSLGTIQNLKEATVVARQELIKTDADKLTYNVQADPMAEGGAILSTFSGTCRCSASTERIKYC